MPLSSQADVRLVREHRIEMSMSEDVCFPIALLASDCGEIESFDSMADLEGSVEALDVANDEYSGWDSDSYQIQLSLGPELAGEDTPSGMLIPRRWMSPNEGWLCVLRSSEDPDEEKFARALGDYFDRIAPDITRQVGESVIQFLIRTESLLEKRKRQKRL